MLLLVELGTKFSFGWPCMTESTPESCSRGNLFSWSLMTVSYALIILMNKSSIYYGTAFLLNHAGIALLQIGTGASLSLMRWFSFKNFVR